MHSGKVVYHFYAGLGARYCFNNVVVELRKLTKISSCQRFTYQLKNVRLRPSGIHLPKLSPSAKMAKKFMIAVELEDAQFQIESMAVASSSFRLRFV